MKQERISEASIPEWFCNTIADYTDANTDRDHDIKWFLSCVGNYVDVAEDGQSFTFRPKAKQMHFERSYHTFLDKVCELTGISLGAFVGETKYDIGMAMYKLNDCFNDKFSFYKIFGEPDEHGLSTVTKLSVKRASVGTDGKPRNYPWCVIVENGRAVKEKTATGGTHIKSGTYQKQRSVFVNINDLDFFNLVYRTTRFIESWELTYGPKLIRDARKLLSEQRAAAQQ